MAFRQLFNCSNGRGRVCDFQPHRAIRGRSTGQVSLGKIVDTICSVSAPPDDLEKSYSSPSLNVLEHGSKRNSDCALHGFDLNLPQGSYHSPPPLPFADDCGTVEKSSVVERDLAEREESRREEDSVGTEITREVTIATDPEAPGSNFDDRSLIRPKGEGCLELLIEAAKLISGGFEDEIDTRAEEIRKGKNSRMSMQEGGSAVCRGRRSRKRARDGEIENPNEAAVVRRSRSGRCNVLPWKYRDSIVEPFSGQRSGTITGKRK